VHIGYLRQNGRLVRAIARGSDYRRRRGQQRSTRQGALHEITAAHAVFEISHESLPSLFSSVPFDHFSQRNPIFSTRAGGFGKMPSFNAGYFGAGSFAALLPPISRRDFPQSSKS
jgi:hypothetical protein